MPDEAGSMNGRERREAHDPYFAVAEDAAERTADAVALGEAPPEPIAESTADRSLRTKAEAALQRRHTAIVRWYLLMRFWSVHGRVVHDVQVLAAWAVHGLPPMTPMSHHLVGFLALLAVAEVVFFRHVMVLAMQLGDTLWMQLVASVIAGSLVPIGHLVGERARRLSRRTDDHTLNVWLAAGGAAYLAVVLAAVGHARIAIEGSAAPLWSVVVFGAMPSLAALFLAAAHDTPSPLAAAERLRAASRARCGQLERRAASIWSDEQVAALRQQCMAESEINWIRGLLSSAFGTQPLQVAELRWISRLPHRGRMVTCWSDFTAAEREEIERVSGNPPHEWSPTDEPPAGSPAQGPEVPPLPSGGSLVVIHDPTHDEALHPIALEEVVQ